MPFLRPISDRYFEDYVEGDVHSFGTEVINQAGEAVMTFKVVNIIAKRPLER